MRSHSLPPGIEAVPPEDISARVSSPEVRLLVARREQNIDFLIILSREFINSNETVKTLIRWISHSSMRQFY